MIVSDKIQLYERNHVIHLNLHNRDDDDNDNNDRDQVGPPKLQAVAGAASLARLVDDILRLSVLGLVIHLEGFFLGFDAVR